MGEAANSQSERRSCGRHPVQLEAAFTWRREWALRARCGEGRGQAENLSDGGAMLRLPSALPSGADLQLCLRESSSGKVLYVQAKLVWGKPAEDGDGFVGGARFTAVPGKKPDVAVRLASRLA